MDGSFKPSVVHRRSPEQLQPKYRAMKLLLLKKDKLMIAREELEVAKALWEEARITHALSISGLGLLFFDLITR